MIKIAALIAALLAPQWPAPAFPDQFPKRAENASATRLLSTLERFGDDLAGVQRGTVPDGFLVKHAATIRTLRAEIVSEAPPVWALDVTDVEDACLPPFRSILRVFTIFAADAKAQPNAATAWVDLHAMWILSQSLWQRPDTTSMAVALAGCRRITETAPKLAGPRPSWWSTFKTFDVRTPLIRSIEYEAFAMRFRAERFPAGEPEGSTFFDAVRDVATPFVRPMSVARAKVAAGKMRELALAAEKSDPCEPFQIEGFVGWKGFVQRFNDYACTATK